MVPLLVLLGCADEPTVTLVDYDLRLVPVVPGNQDPFAGLDTLRLVLDSPRGGTTVVEVAAPGRGSTAVADALPALDETTITLEGWAGDTLVSWGRTEALSAETGASEVEVLVVEVGRPAWLGALAAPRYGAMLQALGDGRFLLAGGLVEGPEGTLAQAYDTVGLLQLSPPAGGLAFTDLGTLPTYTDAWDADQLRPRVGATLDPLGAGTDAGKLLLVGGSTARGVDAPGDITADAALFDPASGAWEAAPGALGVPRAGHVSVTNAQGAVVIAGGWSIPASVDDAFGWTNTVEAWDPAARRFTAAQADPALAAIDPAAADLGVDGVVFCGGAVPELSQGGRWLASRHCTRVGLDFELSDAVDLPAALAGSAMVTLQDGRVLLVGGAIQTERVSLFDAPGAAATANAWITDGFLSWSALAPMALPRAGHRLALLPDGRVAVVGGAASYSPARVPDEAYSCVEIFDPDTNRFTMVDGCDAEDAALGLAGRAWQPSVTVDPEFGALVVGGGNRTESGEVASAQVTLYAPTRDAAAR